eukprot:14784518-Ditylum_brightwellii.AAC.1
MIVRAVLRLRPSLGRMVCAKGFIIWMHYNSVKDVAARDYCIFGSRMFLYRQYAFLKEIDELLSLCATALLIHLGDVSLPTVISRCKGISAVVAIVACSPSHDNQISH